MGKAATKPDLRLQIAPSPDVWATAGRASSRDRDRAMDFRAKVDFSQPALQVYGSDVLSWGGFVVVENELG